MILNILPAWTCQSNEGWEYKKARYGVLTPERMDIEACVYGWYCKCGKTDCTHIQEAKEKHCAWNSELEPALRPKTKGICPMCNGKAITRFVGV